MTLQRSRTVARRSVLVAVALAAPQLILKRDFVSPGNAAENDTSSGKERGNTAKETPATEDLMREHGILRRALIVYGEVAKELTSGRAAQVDASALADTAKLFRDFGENYHERKLEEEHVFPEVIKVGKTEQALVKVLKQQHQRGRDLTDYIERIANTSLTSNAAQLAGVLEGMRRMYEAHAAWEDTILFPAWKKSISNQHYEELTDQFEQLEHQLFGTDGFDEYVGRIANIEQRLGLASLDHYTALGPPA